MDFDGNCFDGNTALPKQMIVGKSTEMICSAIKKQLREQKINLQTPATRTIMEFGHISNAPPVQGIARLIDGTLIQVAKKDNPAGEVIRSSKKIGKHTVTFDAVGIAAIRLDKNGRVETLAAGGLKYFKTGDFIIDLKQRIDLALWKNEKGEIEGIIQGNEFEIPEQLLDITNNWKVLRIPVPLDK